MLPESRLILSIQQEVKEKPIRRLQAASPDVHADDLKDFPAYKLGRFITSERCGFSTVIEKKRQYSAGSPRIQVAGGLLSQDVNG